MAPELRTDRLVLRTWREADLAPFAAMNADPEVVRYLPGPLSRAGSDAFAAKIRARFEDDDVGLWAVEVLATGEFVGFTGLSRPSFAAPFLPAVEVGWRLARAAWGLGYATEAARAAVADGFGRVGLTEIVSFTVLANERSRAVMRRLGMTRDRAGDFEHPSLPPGHPLRQHVLYRLAAPSSGDAGRHAGHDEPNGG
ncbi:GNAT family N-acetyltransferase [soil metagenome]